MPRETERKSEGDGRGSGRGESRTGGGRDDRGNRSEARGGGGDGRGSGRGESRTGGGRDDRGNRSEARGGSGRVESRSGGSRDNRGNRSEARGGSRDERSSGRSRDRRDRGDRAPRGYQPAEGRGYLTLRGVLEDEPTLYAQAGKTPFLRMRVKAEVPIVGGSTDKFTGIYTVKLWGQLALEYGEGNDSLRRGDVVELTGTILYSDWDNPKSGHEEKVVEIAVNDIDSNSFKLLTGTDADQDDVISAELEGDVTKEWFQKEGKPRGGGDDYVLVSGTMFTAVPGGDGLRTVEHRVTCWNDAGDAIWGKTDGASEHDPVRLSITGALLRFEPADTDKTHYRPVITLNNRDDIKLL